MSDQLVTQADDVEQLDPNAVDDGGAGGAEQPFLRVNERTVYKTQEEALRGFNEAQGRITSLSQLQNQIEHYVGKGKATPEYVSALLTELVQERQAKAQGAKSTKSTTSDDPEFEGQSPEQVAQAKAAIKWMETHGPKAGFVSKKDYDELKGQIEKLTGSQTEEYAASQDALADDCRARLTAFLSTSKVDLSENEFKDLEEEIKGYVEGSQKRLADWQRFVKTGNTAAAWEMVEKGARLLLPGVKPGAVIANPAARVAQNGATKAGLISRNPKRMPTDGGAAGKDGKNKPLKFGSSELFERVKSKLAAAQAEENGN